MKVETLYSNEVLFHGQDGNGHVRMSVWKGEGEVPLCQVTLAAPHGQKIAYAAALCTYDDLERLSKLCQEMKALIVPEEAPKSA